MQGAIQISTEPPVPEAAHRRLCWGKISIDTESHVLLECESANDWLRRAGVKLEGGRVILPHDFILLPMTIASKAVVAYNGDHSLENRITQGIVIALSVRTADTAFFNFMARRLHEQNPGMPRLCGNCLRGEIFKNRLKELRREINRKIIHKMEDGSGTGPSAADLPLAVEYYDEMFTLPLVDPITFEAASFSPCRACLRKFVEKKANSN